MLYSYIYGKVLYSYIYGKVLYSYIYGKVLYSYIYGKVLYSYIYGKVLYSYIYTVKCYIVIYTVKCYIVIYTVKCYIVIYTVKGAAELMLLVGIVFVGTQGMVTVVILSRSCAPGPPGGAYIAYLQMKVKAASQPLWPIRGHLRRTKINYLPPYLLHHVETDFKRCVLGFNSRCTKCSSKHAFFISVILRLTYLIKYHGYYTLLFSILCIV